MASIQINDSTYIMAATDRSTDEGIRLHAVHIFDITDIDSPRLVNKTRTFSMIIMAFHFHHM